MPRDEAVQVGDVGEDVVRVDDVGARRPRRRARSASSGAEELARRSGCRAAAAASAMFRAGSMPSTGTPRLAVVLQQVAVVARDLDDEARPGRVRARRSARRRARSAWREHRVGERREVERSRGTALRRHRLGDLHQRAGRAEGEVEREASARARRGRLGATSAFASGVSPEREDDLEPSAAPHERQRGIASCRPLRGSSRYQSIVRSQPLVEREQRPPAEHSRGLRGARGTGRGSRSSPRCARPARGRSPSARGCARRAPAP